MDPEVNILLWFDSFKSKEGVRGVRVMVLNATFNNISVVSWWSV